MKGLMKWKAPQRRSDVSPFRACCLLAAAAAAAAKCGRSTLDPKKRYKTKTGSTISVTLTLTLTLTPTLRMTLAPILERTLKDGNLIFT